PGPLLLPCTTRVRSVVSLVWFALLVNVVSAWLTFAAIAIYVVGYTMILKRRTPQNIVWGGIAGCMPVLIGWSAVTGSLSWAALRSAEHTSELQSREN